MFTKQNTFPLDGEKILLLRQNSWVWKEFLKITQFNPAAQSRVQQIGMPWTLYIWILNISEDGDYTVSQDNLFQCLITLAGQ